MGKHKKIIMVNEFNLDKLLNIVISTSKIKRLKTPVGEIRPQLHCIIYGGMGTGKSSILWEIGRNLGITPTINFSLAGLYGSIDKTTGCLIPPMVWESRNSCLLLDEFSFNTQLPRTLGIIQGLLPVLEIPHINKKLGFRVNDMNEKDGDLHLKVKDGSIDCKTRFTCIINTMAYLKRLSSNWLKAMASRCLVIPHYPSLSELINISKGDVFFKYKPNKSRESIKIRKKDYDMLIEHVSTNIKDSSVYLRALGDCCRIYAVLKKHDYGLYDLIIKMRSQI